MFLCNGAPQRHKHSVIEVQVLSSQKGSFYISLTSLCPISINGKNYLFSYLYFANGRNELNFKALTNFSVPVPFRERSSFELS